MSEASSGSLEEVRVWVNAGEEEVRSLTAEMERAQAQLAHARKRLNLLYEVLASLGQESVAVQVGGADGSDSVREKTIAAAREILRDRGRPMSLVEIHAEFVRRSKPLPGRGRPTNILAHISASPDFVRLRRGTYGLANWPVIARTDAASNRPEAHEE